jgi:hypothetical protein
MRATSVTPRCSPQTANAGLCASMPADAPTLTKHSVSTLGRHLRSRDSSILLLRDSRGGLACSPSLGAGRASAWLAPSMPSTSIGRGAAAGGWHGRCDGRVTEHHIAGGLPPKRLVLPKPISHSHGRRLRCGASVSQLLECRSMETDSTSLFTLGSCETETFFVISTSVKGLRRVARWVAAGIQELGCCVGRRVESYRPTLPQ